MRWVVLLALSGCAHGVGVQIGQGFTDDEQAIIWEAYDEWPPDAYPNEMIHIDHVSEVWVHGVQRDGNENAMHIQLVSLEDRDLFRRAVAHELGHTMGLRHINTRYSIMNEILEYTADRPQEFDIMVAESNARNGR